MLELVRELEGAQTPAPEADVRPPQVAAGEPAFAQVTLSHPVGTETRLAQRNFCGHCGSRLKEEKSGEPKQLTSSLALPPSLPHIEGGRDEQCRSSDAQSIETGIAHENRHSRKQVALVVFISIALAIWSVWRIRVEPALHIASSAIPIPQPGAVKNQISGAPRGGETGKTASLPLVRDSSARLSKPAAGKPIGCRNDYLRNCSVNELYGRTITLANEIDGLFTDYDKRVTRLLREASVNVRDTAQHKQNRSRQANYSAQLWEHLQLGSYASHQRYDALKYRAELLRRGSVTGPDRQMLGAYQSPRSCLELHYIAEDLRRLAAGLRRAGTTSRTSPRRVAGVPQSR
ncbi:MAG: hypothetical protein WA628_16030 [Terriglobales bacterium]